MKGIKSFFNPGATAVVGVSDNPIKLGSVIFSNMIESGYEGKLYPVNPRYDELYGYKSYKSVKAINGEVDLAVIVVPAPFVEEVMRDCAAKKVKSVIIISAGFKEVGREGEELEEKIVKIANESGIRVIGPNCLGVISSENVNASFAASRPVDGNIAFASQSGAFCTAMLDMSIPANLGFSHFVSFGNKADVNENDLFTDWMTDDNVKVIGAYIEEISNGIKLIDILKNSKEKKPVIILKPGQTNEAKEAISSHTGAMAGSIETFKTAMKQNGFIEAENIRDLFNLLMAFSWSKPLKGKNIGVVTNAGGPGIIATDAIIQGGLEMAKISEISKKNLSKVLPDTAALNNPVDVIGDANAERYENSIATLIDDDNVDAVMVLLTPQLITQIEETTKVIINLAKKSDKPIIPVYLGEKYILPAYERFYDNMIPAYKDPKDAIKVLKEMYDFYQISRVNGHEDKERNLLMKNLKKGNHRSKIMKIKKDGSNALSDDIVTLLAEEVGLDLPKQGTFSDVEEAISFAKDIFPIAMKAPNSVIAHKTDFKALYLNIQDEKELRESFIELKKKIEEVTKISDPEILVQEMIDIKEEIFIGANRDGDENVYESNSWGFGHLIAFGKGGIYTEVYKDIDFVTLPASKSEIRKAFDKTKVSEIVKGVRGQKPLAYDKIIETIAAVEKMLVLYPEIASVDLNPVLLTEDRAVAVDIKIFIA